MNDSPHMDNPTFSQVHGLQEIPGPPTLEHISEKARNYLWNVLWMHLQRTALPATLVRPHAELGQPWRTIFAVVHLEWDRPLDEFSADVGRWHRHCKGMILRGPYNICFDLLQRIMRHQECPHEFTEDIKEIFLHHLAYRIDTTSLPTIVPAATMQEGDALIGALRDLEGTGLSGASEHLRQAGERIQDQDWAGSVRESIHAVESVAKRVAPSDADTLGKALVALERQQGLHGALKRGFAALYGYTSDEQGIRHAQSGDESRVTQDEALFMIGACAAFCSYLWRKFGPQGASSVTEPD